MHIETVHSGGLIKTNIGLMKNLDTLYNNIAIAIFIHAVMVNTLAVLMCILISYVQVCVQKLMKIYNIMSYSE